MVVMCRWGAWWKRTLLVHIPHACKAIAEHEHSVVEQKLCAASHLHIVLRQDHCELNHLKDFAGVPKLNMTISCTFRSFPSALLIVITNYGRTSVAKPGLAVHIG